MLSPKPWKLDAVARLGLGVLLSMSVGALVATLLKLSADPGAGRFVIGTLSFHGAALLFVQLFLWEHGLTWAEAFGLRASHSACALGAALVVTAVVLPGAWSLTWLSMQALSWCGLQPHVQPAVTVLQQTVRPAQQVYLALMTIALAPAAEEVLFRGILYPALKNELGRTSFHGVASWLRAGVYPWFRRHRARRLAAWVRGVACPGLRSGLPCFPMVLSSLLFGAAHFHLPSFLPLAVLGLALAILYEATGNLLAPVLSHSLFNLANFFLVIVGQPKL